MVVIFAFVLFLVPGVQRTVIYASEDISLYMAPSAGKAFSYGERHFRALDPRSYDLSRAKTMYQKAATLDPDHPMVFHQLARTSFVSNALDTALMQINIQLARHPDSPPSAYYVRALSYAFLDRYEESARDYETYLKTDSRNWPGYNDYAWMLLKIQKPAEALAAIDTALGYVPENAWLLITRSVALYELKRYDEAHAAAVRAKELSDGVTIEDWSKVNPGNSPTQAGQGVAEMRRVIDANIAKIEAVLKNGTGQK